VTARFLVVVAALSMLVTGAAGAATYHIVGTDGDDRLVGTPERNWMEGFGGDDRLFGGAGNDDLGDDKGKDTLIGGPGKDSLDGRRDLDVLRGGEGNDFLADYHGGDILRGGAGRDTAAMGQDEEHKMPATEVYLGDGQDLVIQNDDDKRDFIDCGSGHDRVEWVTTQDELDEIVNCEVITEYLGP